MVVVPYGRAPYPLDLGDRSFTTIELPSVGPAPPVRDLVEAALDQPIGRPRIEQLVRPGDRVTVIVSDTTRSEPRADFLAAVRGRLPETRLSIAIATGTHGPCGIDALDLPCELLAGATIIDHDGHRDDDLIELGTTRHGTVTRVHRCVVETDLVIATGCIRPHYFAGFGAGVKAIFPGLGAARDVRHNHALKQQPGAAAGIVVGNPCRADLEEAVGFVPATIFLVNGVCASDGVVHAAVAGDPVAAFRVGVEQARSWFAVQAEPADLVIASDPLPVTSSVYQAAKIAAAVAPLVRPDGMLLVVAECADGIGTHAEPRAALAVVNDAILRIGVLPRLAAGVRLGLLSGLPEALVRETLFEPISSIASALNQIRGSIAVVPRASQILLS
jgi:lactate racemase